MRCAAAPGVLAEMAAILDESFASTASKIGSTHPACTTGLSRDRFAAGGGERHGAHCLQQDRYW